MTDLNEKLYLYLNEVNKWATYKGYLGREDYQLDFAQITNDLPPMSHTMAKDGTLKIFVETSITRSSSIGNFFTKNNKKDVILRTSINSIDVGFKFIPKSLKITQLDITQKAQDFINSLQFYNGISNDLNVNDFNFIESGDVIPATMYTERNTITPTAECFVKLHYVIKKTFVTPFEKIDELIGNIIVHEEKF